MDGVYHKEKERNLHLLDVMPARRACAVRVEVSALSTIFLFSIVFIGSPLPLVLSGCSRSLIRRARFLLIDEVVDDGVGVGAAAEFGHDGHDIPNAHVWKDGHNLADTSVSDLSVETRDLVIHSVQ